MVEIWTNEMKTLSQINENIMNQIYKNVVHQ
jgi:hypothetical protein